MFLVDGSIFAGEVGRRLCVEPDVKVLKWEEGESRERKQRGERRVGSRGGVK